MIYWRLSQNYFICIGNFRKIWIHWTNQTPKIQTFLETHPFGWYDRLIVWKFKIKILSFLFVFHFAFLFQNLAFDLIEIPVFLVMAVVGNVLYVNLWAHNTIKMQNIWTPEKLAVTIQKFKHSNVCSLIWVYTVCSDLSVQKPSDHYGIYTFHVIP